MKKKFEKAITKIADEMVAEKIVTIGNQEFKNLLLTVKIGSNEYNVWKSNKNDGKYEVIKLADVSDIKIADKDSHQRLTKEEVLKNVILKAFYKGKEYDKIVERLSATNK